MQENPAFLYGESVFVTLRVECGKVLFKKQQLRRLNSFVSAYYLNRELKENESYFLEESLNQKAIEFPNCILKMMVFSGARASLVDENTDFKSLQLHFAKRDIPIVTNNHSLKTFKSPFSLDYPNIKMGSYMPHFFIRKMALRAQASDCLFLSGKEVLETSTSNIIFAKGDELYTPMNTIYDGVIRETFINEFNINEIKIDIDTIKDFSNVFIVNSANLIMGVSSIDDISFQIDDTVVSNWKRKLILRGLDE